MNKKSNINPQAPKTEEYEDISIMDCSAEELKTICTMYLQKFDDYQQITVDVEKGHLTEIFVYAYECLEYILKAITNDESLITDTLRQEIRSIIKQTEKVAAIELYFDKTTNNE